MSTSEYAQYTALLRQLWDAVDADAAGPVAELLGPDRRLFPVRPDEAEPLWLVTRRAAGRGATAVLELLLGKFGCDPNWKERSDAGSTAMHWAAASGNVAVIRTLVDASADPTLVDGLSVTPLHVAAADGHLDVVRALLLVGASVATQSATGWGPLDSAAWEGNLPTAQLLVRNGADISRPCADVDPSRGDRLPAQLAADRGHHALAQWLREWDPRELYWSRWNHFWCLPWSISAVVCVFSTAARIAAGCDANQTGRCRTSSSALYGASTADAAHSGGPGAIRGLWLPIELWYRVLGFCARNELGRRTH